MKRNPGGRNQESFLSHVFTFPRRAQTWQEHKVSVKCTNASQEQNTASAGIWIWNLQQSSLPWPWGGSLSTVTILYYPISRRHIMEDTTLPLRVPHIDNISLSRFVLLMEKYIFCCQQLENNCTCEVICWDAALLVQLTWEVVNTCPSQWAAANIQKPLWNDLKQFLCDQRWKIASQLEDNDNEDCKSLNKAWLH